MQARRRFIQNIKGTARRALCQLFLQFDALRLTARQRCGLLADLDIAQTHPHQCIHFFTDRWHRLKKRLRIFDRHIQHICNAFAFEFNLQRFAIVARAIVGFAGHIDIG